MRRLKRPNIAPYPLTFHACYQQRVWGGRRLELEFDRRLPPGSIGESWELVDRAGASSVVDQGPLVGTTLEELWQTFPDWFPAPGTERPTRFPLLVKLLDCHEPLSVQVHPSPEVAAALGGEPKAELWYFLDTTPDTIVYAGFRRGTTRERVTRALARGSHELVERLHTLHPRPGDALLVPPGRVHALGPGSLLCEIQQNSDTTYRLHDWDRHAGGSRRPLHTREALRALDFCDWEPSFVPRETAMLVDGPWFRVTKRGIDSPSIMDARDRFLAALVTHGTLHLDHIPVTAGRCFLLPRGTRVTGRPRNGPAHFLEVTLA